MRRRARLSGTPAGLPPTPPGCPPREMVGPTLQLLALSALCVGTPAGEFRDVLERLSITQYAPALRAEDIGSPSDLAALSGDDMEALGLRIGARNRLRAWQRAQLQQHGAGPRSATTRRCIR